MNTPIQNLQRLSPRLRMVVDGDDEVNAFRSVLSASVTALPGAVEEAECVEGLRQASQIAPPRHEPLVERFTDRVRFSCFVHLEQPETVPPELHAAARRASGGRGRKQRSNLVIAEMTRREIEKLAEVAVERGVAYVEAGTPLAHPRPTRVQRVLAPPLPRDRFHDADEARRFYDAQAKGPVLIGFVDVGGFDFAHPDFLDANGETRFHAIWDQGAVDGAPPKGFGYGRELTRAEMNRAIRGAAEVGVAPSDIAPQTVQAPGSHGTHVASIAGGERGVCPDALLAGVLIALDEEDRDRHRTFFDSTRLAQALEYLFELGARLGPMLNPPVQTIPTVVNVSLGTNGHAHDGTSPISRWIDDALSQPGRCVCVAAGNAGQEGPQFEGDLGYVSGRIHASGRVPSRGLTFDLQWEVVGNGIVDVSENEMEIWYEAGDEFAVSVRPPSGGWTGVVGPGEFYENRHLVGPETPVPSETFLSVYNERYHPANGANRISIFLSPKLKGAVKGIQAGTWTVRLHGVEVRDGRFDAWIERDDPRPLGRIGESQAWRFPSYFSMRSNVDRCSVSSLACGRDVIAVGNGDAANECIHVSSSQGPTRDGRYKPDIAAPGTDVVAARGFGGGDPRQQWTKMTGTSMASPLVAGVAARMLAVEPRLSAVQILGIMRRTAQPLPGTDYQWRDDAGFGQIRPGGCMEQVPVPFHTVDLEEAP